MSEIVKAAQPVDWDKELIGCRALLKSGLLPPSIKTAEAALFLVLTGRDLGLSPVQSLRSIHIIQGKVELSADLQLGLFQRQGGKFRWLKLDATGAELELQAPWLTKPHVSVFGPEEARKAELMSSANYRKYPQAMFRSRAITQGLKDVGFLASWGIYAPGELGGEVVINEETGEVLPAEEARAPAKEITSTAGTVEALPDAERLEIENYAQTISQALQDGQAEAAWNAWHSRINDEKVAIWALLDRETRKALKALDAAAKAKDPPRLEDAVDLWSVDQDAALDIVRSLSPKDQAQFYAQTGAERAPKEAA